MIWTDEMDASIRRGHEAGLSARLISEQLGVTRNAVLGRTFRLGLCKSYSEPREPASTAARRVSMTAVLIQKNFLPAQLAEHIRDLRDMGASWKAVGDDLGVSMVTARNYASKFGLLIPSETKPIFSPAEYSTIIRDWNNNVPVEDIADKLDRSFGAVRQKILKLQREGRLGSRDAAKTRLLKQYGEAALDAGATPVEALRKMAEAKQMAFAAALKASRAAKRHRFELALAELRTAIASGLDRNAAIFACRAEGVSLQEIASEFDITRERVRQICNDHAQEIALKALLS